MAVLLEELLRMNAQETEQELGLPSQKCTICQEPFTHADRIAEEIEEKAGSGKVHVGCGDPPDPD